MNDVRRRGSQRAPVGGTNSFRNDFGEDQYEQSQDNRGGGEPAVPQLVELSAYTCGTDGVCYRVERQDSRQWRVNFLLEAAQQLAAIVPLPREPFYE